MVRMGDSHGHRSSGRKRSNDEDDPSGKKQKNRDAAWRSREKKRKETETLKKKNEELVQTNKELHKKKKELEEKLCECIREINDHKNFGCHLPSNVTAILNSTTELHEDFRPVGTQEISLNSTSFEQRSNSPSSSSHESEDGRAAIAENQPKVQVQGLFSGDTFVATFSGQTIKRNMSSRSPSRSPPPPPQAGAFKSQPSTSSSREVSLGTKQAMTASWTRLHQQTQGHDKSPDLSPAQTVPNIDSDRFNYHDTERQSNQSDFPDISEAVKIAQRAPGVEVLSPSKDKRSMSLPSCGFIPTLSPLPREISQNQVLNHLVTGNESNHAVMGNNLLKPCSTTKATVSMNHTAELLSQAFNNLDPTEISEDLKKEFVRVAASSGTVTETNTNNFLSQSNPGATILPNFVEASVDSSELIQENVQTAINTNSGQCFVITKANQIYQTIDGDFVFAEDMKDVTQEQSFNSQMQPQASFNNDSSFQPLMPTQPSSNKDASTSITWDNLLEMARSGQQQIIIKVKGEDVSCNYETLKELASRLKSNDVTYAACETSDVFVNKSGNVSFDIPFQNHSYVLDILNQNTSHTLNIPQQNTQYIFDALQDSGEVTMNSTNPFTFGQGLNVPQAQYVEIPAVENVQLPTTVQAIIQEDGPTQANLSPAIELDDYSENVKDLPSLSLQEDHSQIFEKKRKLN